MYFGHWYLNMPSIFVKEMILYKYFSFTKNHQNLNINFSTFYLNKTIIKYPVMTSDTMYNTFKTTIIHIRMLIRSVVWIRIGALNSLNRTGKTWQYFFKYDTLVFFPSKFNDQCLQNNFSLIERLWLKWFIYFSFA